MFPKEKNTILGQLALYDTVYSRSNISVPKISDQFVCSNLAVPLTNFSIFLEKFITIFKTFCLLTNQNPHE